MIYSSDGEVYEDATQHQLDVPKLSKSDEAPITPSSEDVKSMTHEKPEGKLQTPLLTHLSNKLLETNKTIGDLMTGRLDVNSPEGAYAAVDLAFKTAGYGMLGAEMSAYNKGLGIFGGRMSQAAKLTAEQMEKSSKFTDEQIKRWTGLERGTEGMWRKELSDVDAVSKLPTEKVPTFGDFEHGDFTRLADTDTLRTGAYKLGDVLEHKELFKAYPEFKDMPVYVLPDSQKTSHGWYDPTEKSITINSKQVLDNKQAIDTMVHELQHAVQHKEGFSIGYPEHLDYAKLTEAVKKKPKDYTKEDRAVIAQYWNQAHEVEARNATSRMMLSKEELARSLGKDTEDVNRLDQFVLSLEEGKEFKK